MFPFIGRCLRKAAAWCALWNELWLFGLGVLTWPFAVWLIVQLGGEGTLVFDFGIPMSALHNTVLMYGGITAFVWVGIYLNFRVVWNFFQRDFIVNFHLLTPWHKMLIALFVFSLYLSSSLYVLSSVLSTAMAPVQKTTIEVPPAY